MSNEESQTSILQPQTVCYTAKVNFNHIFDLEDGVSIITVIFGFGRYPPGQTPPWAETPLGRHFPMPSASWDTPLWQPLQRTVRILLECILVHFYFVKIDETVGWYPSRGLAPSFENS